MEIRLNASLVTQTNSPLPSTQPSVAFLHLKHIRETSLHFEYSRFDRLNPDSTILHVTMLSDVDMVDVGVVTALPKRTFSQLAPFGSSPFTFHLHGKSCASSTLSELRIDSPISQEFPHHQPFERPSKPLGTRRICSPPSCPRSWLNEQQPPFRRHADRYVGPGPHHEVEDKIGLLSVNMDEPLRSNGHNRNGGGNFRGGDSRKRRYRGMFRPEPQKSPQQWIDGLMADFRVSI